MSNVTTIGIDLAKNVFQLHGADKRGKRMFSKRLGRGQLMEFLAQIPPSVIGIEACTGAHYWARHFIQLGHTVKMMAPQFVKPYVKSNKNDKNDAAAIAEAVTRPDMKFVPIKSVEQQDIQMLHRVRELLVKQRTALANQTRGLLAEYGVIIPKGIGHIRSSMMDILANAENELTTKGRKILHDLYKQFKLLDKKIDKYEQQMKDMSRSNKDCQRLMAIEGIGPITATAIIGAVGDANVFKKGREFSAWLGLVPRQHSSGNKTRLLGISKRGDRYLRTLLIHGARSVVRVAKDKADKRSQWVMDKKTRCGENKAAVALANKNARIIWALLANNETYRKAAIAA
jgi:transposase